MKSKPRLRKTSILKGGGSYSTSYDSNPSEPFENGSFSSTSSAAASSHHHSHHHGGSEDDSGDDNGEHTVALLQPKHGSESFEEEVTLDVDPLLPERTTDAAAASIVRLPPQAIAALPAAMARTLAGRYEGFVIPHRNEIRYAFPDPMKFLFNDWHFSFIPKTPYVSLPPLAAPPTSKRRHGGAHRKISSSTPLGSELLHSPVPPLSVGGRSPHQPSSLPSRAPSRATPQALTLQPPLAPETTHPADVVEAIEVYMTKKMPHALTLEGLSFGAHPNALCYFFFSALSKNACGSLRKLHLPFCDITSRTLLLLVAGLENASRTTQHLLTEIDLSHNKLTQQSVPILTLMLMATKVLSLGLHGNKIGTAVLDGSETSDPHDRDLPTPMPPRSTVPSSQSDRQGLKAARGARLRKSSASATEALLEKAKGTLAQFVVFARDACPRLESLDIGFTNLSPDEQAVLVSSIVRMTQLKRISLDGLKLTPNNAAKLAVAVVDSVSLWSISVNFNTSCSSAQYQDKLRSHCENRRVLAHLPKLRRNTSFGRVPSSTLHLSTTGPPGMLALKSKRNFLDLDNAAFVDDWAISEGYAKYTTNDPSLRKRK